MIDKNLLFMTYILSIILLLISCCSSDNGSEDNISFPEEKSSEALESSDYSTDENSSPSDENSSALKEESSDNNSSESDYSEGSFVEEVSVDLETYQNSLMDATTPNAWENYGFGDPFVMRYNGKYYLYSSTHDWYTGIKVWSSDNLIDWKYEGLCAIDDRLKSAYAPEVTYYNGNFYMYTSPAGNGHYVLQADNPLGPFKIMTDNLGNSIDGHVFIDDNGKWYFYHAWEKELKAYEMSNPYDLSWKDKNIGASVAGGWTEGPMVIKRNGVYYLTYCGNHVWSKGYRIEGATSITSPLDFSDVSGSIIMLNTTPPLSGIGHSSTVLGPDMDTYYIVYHTFIREGSRAMNIDPLSLNGKDFLSLGPTSTPQQAPKQPEISTDSKTPSDKFTYEKTAMIDSTIVVQEGGFVLSKDIISSEKYTAEVNFKSITEKSGIVFSYVDSNNYTVAFVDVETQKLNIKTYKDGKQVSSISANLPNSFNKNVDFSVLQALSIKKDGNNYSFFLNGLSIATIRLDIPCGKLGAMVLNGEAALGYMAISLEANGSSLKTFYKPIKGKFHAITSIEEGETVKDKTITYAVMKPNSTRNYYVNIGKTTSYDVGISYYSETDSVIEIYKGGELLGSVDLPNTNGILTTISMRNIKLEKSFGVITFKLVSGQANIFTYDFVESEELFGGTISLDKPKYSDGTWIKTDKELSFYNTTYLTVSHGKVLYGSEAFGDYSFSSTISFNEAGGEVGMLIRAKNPALGGAGDSANLGRYFYQGYYICLNWEKGIILYDVNYSRGEILSYYEMSFSEKTEYTLKVEVKGNNIKIYLDGLLIGEIFDNTPFLNGSFGFTGYDSNAIITNAKIEKAE